MGSVLKPQHYPGPDPDEGLGVQHLPHGLGDVDHQHPVMQRHQEDGQEEGGDPRQYGVEEVVLTQCSLVLGLRARGRLQVPDVDEANAWK